MKERKKLDFGVRESDGVRGVFIGRKVRGFYAGESVCVWRVKTAGIGGVEKVLLGFDYVCIHGAWGLRFN